MATQMPARGICLPRMTSGEKRLSERLEHKLDDSYLIWYDVAIGPKQLRPDFIVLHPSRGLLVLEVKDIPVSNLRHVDKQTWHFHDAATQSVKAIESPFEQARGYAHAVVKLLEKDKQLIQHEGRHQGKLGFAWSYGVVLPNITRAQFEQAELGQALEPQRVICKDEMLESVDAEDFQSRLWNMFPYARYVSLSLPQIHRVRGILFPELRIGQQADLFANADDEAPEVPDLMQVMDVQQEQLARSLGSGHRVIHGVAGSGKTMILGFRAEHLARAFAQGKPILVLCFNRALSQKLSQTMRDKGLADRVHCRTFHSWCSEQLRSYGQDLPPTELARQDRFADEVNRVMRGVALGHIPAGQYMSVLIDEGHDFEPAWLKLVVQMVDPDTNSLLVLYDDAQSIYQKRRKGFSLKSVGIQAQGRTSVFHINYRNTRQILGTASAMASDLLRPASADEDGIPTLSPVSCGRDGPAPLVIDLPSASAQAEHLAQALLQCHRDGHAWRDMAVLCHDSGDLFAIEAAAKRHAIPRNPRGEYFVDKDRISMLSMKVSKGLEFEVVALLGGVAQSATPDDAEDERRLHYVAATRATHRLIVARRQLPSAA